MIDSVIPAMTGTPAAVEVPFQQHEVVLGSAARQTVLTGFLLDGAMAEIAVVHVDEHDDRRLRIYAFEGDTWTPTLETTLGSEVSFVDVANLGGRDRLLTYEPGRLNWLDPESATEHALVTATTSFKPPREDEIPHVDVTRDLNGDGRDDLVVPDVDGFWVFVQVAGGAFAEPVKIGPPTDMAGIYGADGYRYDPWSQGRVHEVDYEGDGRRDLAFWNEDHFAVHRQDARGLFASKAETFTTEVAFDSDEPFSLATGDMVGKVLCSVSDLDGDGVADLVTHSLEGATVSSKRTAFEVHFGTPTPDGGTAFARDADLEIESERIQLRMDRHDFDGDGQVDIMVTTLGTGYLDFHPFRAFRGFMGGSIFLELELYRMEGGRYPDSPDAIRLIKLRFPPTHREPGWVPLTEALRGGTHENRSSRERDLGAFNSPLLLGDVTGDGRADLLIGWTRRQMRVFAGVPGRDLFTQRPHEVNVDMPDDGEYAWLVDLDRDGRQDLVLHDPSNTEPHRLTLLIAR